MKENSSASLSLFFRNLLLVLGYMAGVAAIIQITLNFSGDAGLWNAHNLLNWDAAHYYTIAFKGYVPGEMAFFPLFPMLWRVTALGSIGITFFNAGLFALVLAFLVTVFNTSAKETLLFLNFPSLVFIALPYTEALFFAGSVLLLVGLKKENFWITILGIVIASFTRPVIYVFVPAFIIMAYLKRADSKVVMRYVVYITVVILCLAVLTLVQYSITHEWFSFFSEQKGGWGNQLGIPGIPFRSWGGDNMTKFDGTAFLVGVVATIVLVVYITKRRTNFSSEQLFSILYLSGICCIIVLTRGGFMFSLNRFVYTTPFLLIGLTMLLKKQWSTKSYVIILFSLNAFWLLFGSYVHIQEVLKYALVSLFLMCFLFISHPKKYLSLSAYMICLLGNIALQVYFYQYFLKGGWIG